ncbi:hypothetical protein D0X99_19690 [Algoriphagus lacus]|uniref:Uncharacterized protein n=1 Tax=Algoriphagus lacus TaxID=2056311 RepID=A0A418PLP2_9BACT|nr:hypothetical protein D0X99_19690 [Algoriphagus lacus]
MPEGVFELESVHGEESGWAIRVGEGGWIRHVGPDRLPGHLEIAPVTEFKSGAKPTFTRLAFQKLLDELGGLWERGEVVELQVTGAEIPYRLSACPMPNFS